MVLITGGTGTVGSEVVKQLAATGQKFRVLARDPGKALKAPNVEVVKGDLADAATLETALKGVSKLFLLINSVPGTVEILSKAVGVAKQAGVKHVVRLSVLGADPKSPVQMARWHAEIEGNVKASGLAWTMLRPGYFMQNMLGNAATIKKDGAFYGCSGDGKFCPIDARDIAAAAVKSLTGEGHEGKAYELTGQESLSMAEIAEKLGKALGKKVTYVNLPPEKFKQGLISAGLPEWLAQDFTTMFSFFGTGAIAKPDPTLGQLIGKVRTFDDFLSDNAQSFR